MRLVHLTSPGRLELNFLWLPTWLGINKEVKDLIERELKPRVIGMSATEESLDAINEQVLDLLVSHYPSINGLRDYLDGLKFVKI